MEDFWRQCFDRRSTPKEFRRMFCRVCRNQDCTRAESGKTKWVQRILTQEDRLINNPQFADPDDPKYKALQEVDFPNLFQRALIMEIADRKGDWEPVTPQDILRFSGEVVEGPKDSETSSSGAVDAAVRALKGQEVVPPSPGEKPQTEVLWEARVRGSKKESYRVALEEVPGSEPKWSCSCPAFNYKTVDRKTGYCKHIMEAMPYWEEFNKPDPPRLPVPEPRVKTVVGPERRNFTPPMGNIPVPSEGIMVGGPPATKRHQEFDPWEIPKKPDNIIPVGGKVRMGLKQGKE